MSARDEGGAYARIRENLSELGLDAMAAGLPHWMSAVAAGEADFASAMLAMTSEEAEAKRRRGTDRKVRAAGFPFVKTLADFDFSFQPSIPRAVVDDLATLRFLDAAENVVLVGSPGVGKTHIAVALGVEAVRARKEVRFTDCAALVRDLKDASSRGILAKRLKYYAHATLLIIDELGYLDVDEEGADLLFQLVSARYEHRSTVITTNVAVGLWADVFGDAVTAAAIADRVCHHCTMLKITGRSYRMKDLLAEAADGDGLPDGWEVQYGLDPLDNGTTSMRTGGAGNANNGAAGDPDGDGFTNAQELASGTHPTQQDVIGGGEGEGSIFIGTFTQWTHRDLLVLDEYNEGNSNGGADDAWLALASSAARSPVVMATLASASLM